jgi:predicted nucleotidyltransferase
MLEEISNYVALVGRYFASKLGGSLVEAYKLGSLAHGGFSRLYSDIDVCVLLDCKNPPEKMAQLISEAKELDLVYGKKLSVFWGNPTQNWGRLPVIDRLDLLDHGVPVLNGVKALLPRPGKAAIHGALYDSIEKSWKPRVPELSRLTSLELQDRKPYIRAILYPARLIFTWDNLAVDSNDRAVDYLRSVRPAGLDLSPIELALSCRRDEYTAEEIFAMRPDLHNQLDRTLSYIEQR